MSKYLSTAIAAAFVVCAGPAAAITLTELTAIDYQDPDGLAFDSTNGSLWVVDGSSVTNIETDGTFKSSFADPNSLDGITVFGSDLVVVQSGDADLKQVTKAGAPVGTISPTPNTYDGSADGIHYDPLTNQFFLADDTDEMIYILASDGTIVSSFSTKAILPDFDEPEGITYDPISGNILVVDDSGGTSSLYELSITGMLIGSIDLAALNLGGQGDAEGIALDTQTNTLFIAYDNEDVLISYSYSATPPAPDVIPLPAGLPLLVGGLAAFGLIRRSTRRA